MSTTRSLPAIYTHSEPRETLIPLLSQLLPYTLPLLRRIQFHAHSPHAIVLSTTDPSDPPSIAQSPSNFDTFDLPPFAALYIDRSRAPETECWLFSTAELPQPATSQSPSSITPHSAAYPHILSLLSHAASLPLPTPPSTQDPSSIRTDPDLLLLGSLHSTNLSLLKSLGTLDTHTSHASLGHSSAASTTCQARGNPSSGGVIRGHTIAWLKYVFAPNSDAAPEVELPAGLEWTEVDNESDIQLIISRSPIPRTPSTIRTWAGAAVRETGSGALAAWGFIAADGSLAALHVEERWRRRGLARAVVGRLMEDVGRVKVRGGEDGAERLAFEGAGEDTWVHSDTGEDNVSARGVLGGLGGTVGWRCYWTWVDLGRVREVVGVQGR